jgi:glutaredoxin
MAKNYFREHQVKFTDYNVARDQRKAEEMVKKSGQMGVPVIDINGKIIVGFDRAQIDRLLVRT